MIIEYTGRQFVVTQKYKDRTQKGLKRIERIVGGAASAHIILSLDKYRKIAEVAVVDGSQNMVAICESVEMMTALGFVPFRIFGQMGEPASAAVNNARSSLNLSTAFSTLVAPVTNAPAGAPIF